MDKDNNAGEYGRILDDARASLSPRKPDVSSKPPRKPDVVDAEFKVIPPESMKTSATEKGGIFADINSVNQLAADLNAKLDNKIVADEKYIPALKSAGRTSSEQKRISDELGQLRLDKDRNFKLRENLNRLDYYLRNAAAVETQRDQLIRDGKNPEELKKFEEQNIPAEARGQIILPPEAQRNDVENAYGEKVDAWIDAATAAQDKARAEIAEKNMPESERRIKDLERQLVTEKTARELAENRLVMEQATRKQAEQAREAAIADAQRLRDDAARLNTERAAEIERDHLLTPPPSDQNPDLANDINQPQPQERRNGLWRAFGNTAIGALVGTTANFAGRALSGGVWEVGAFAAGSVRSGIDRVREVGSREGLASVMSREIRGGHRGIRQGFEAWANLEAEAGRLGVRAVARFLEETDRPSDRRRADVARNVAGSLILDRMDNGQTSNEQFVQGVRGAFDAEFADHVSATMDRDGISRDEATTKVLRYYARDLTSLSSQLWYDTQVGGYKIADLLRQNGLSLSREQLARTVGLTQAAMETEARMMIGQLQQSGEAGDRELANELIQQLAENRNNRIDGLRLVYLGTGTIAGGVKALGVAELFHGIASNIWPQPETPSAGTVSESTPAEASATVGQEIRTATFIPETGGRLIDVNSGQTWGEVLHNEYGYSGPQLWGWGQETGTLWADRYLPALMDPRNADRINQYYRTASAAYPVSQTMFEVLGYDAGTKAFDGTRIGLFSSLLKTGDSRAVMMVKEMAHVLRPGGLWIGAK